MSERKLEPLDLMAKQIHYHKKENADMLTFFTQMKANNAKMLKALQKATKKAHKNKKRHKIDSDFSDFDSE